MAFPAARAVLCSFFARLLLLGFALGGMPSAGAGNASAAFRVTASLLTTGETATCRISPRTELPECASTSAPAVDSPRVWKPLVVAEPGFQMLLFAPQFKLTSSTYSGELGAYSVTRLVIIGGREFLETTVTW